MPQWKILKTKLSSYHQNLKFYTLQIAFLKFLKKHEFFFWKFPMYAYLAEFELQFKLFLFLLLLISSKYQWNTVSLYNEDVTSKIAF